jgi:hypothetical protein
LQASVASIDGNLAHELRRLCNLYRYFVFRGKSQIDRCLAFIEQSPRARLIIAAGFVGFIVLVLRKLGQSGMRLAMRVRRTWICVCEIFVRTTDFIMDRRSERFIPRMLLSKPSRQETRYNIEDGSVSPPFFDLFSACARAS